jgi:hypothetical protein
MLGTLEERVAQLEAKCLAYEIVLLDLIHDSWPLEQHRRERRDSACRAVEPMVSDPLVNNHFPLLGERILEAIENLFGMEPPRPDEPRP